MCVYVCFVPGQMCVHVAAAKGHLEAIQTLVYFGADINARVSNHSDVDYLEYYIFGFCLRRESCSPSVPSHL